MTPAAASAPTGDPDRLGRGAGAVPVEPVGQGSRCRLIHQTKDFEAGDAACVFRGLALGVVEVGRYRDDCFCHRRVKESFSIALELAQDKS